MQRLTEAFGETIREIDVSSMTVPPLISAHSTHTQLIARVDAAYAVLDDMVLGGHLADMSNITTVL